MGILVRAVYQEGQLHLLDPVDLGEGQVVQITIGATMNTPQPIDAQLQAAGLLLDLPLSENARALSPEERQRIGRLFVGERRLEDLIDEDRGLV
jgi:predicted DNA-binding antitoxin AbrB/MazE fold protein